MVGVLWFKWFALVFMVLCNTSLMCVGQSREYPIDHLEAVKHCFSLSRCGIPVNLLCTTFHPQVQRVAGGLQRRKAVGVLSRARLEALESLVLCNPAR